MTSKLMLHRNSSTALVLALVLGLSATDSNAQDDRRRPGERAERGVGA